MIRLTRRYGFSASHRLHSSLLSDEENNSIYGKCNNPFGHGHNYEIELTLLGPVDRSTGRVVDLAALDRLAQQEILTPLSHRNLNEEVAAFREAVPTTENLAIELDRRLRGAWPSAFPSGPELETIRIRETDRNICEIGGVRE
jgi:6-pyruvoyltetrahydropterin/6-carboxytetrahydropterin synthase